MNSRPKPTVLRMGFVFTEDPLVAVLVVILDKETSEYHEEDEDEAILDQKPMI